MHNGTTITQFIIEEQRKIEGATGDFTSLLNDIVTACKVISNLVNKGELIGVLDIDSPDTRRFSAADQAGVEKLCETFCALQEARKYFI